MLKRANRNFKSDLGSSIPKTKTVEISECERFILGLKKIMDEVCCPKSLTTDQRKNILELIFSDGSSVGINRLFEETGYFDLGCRK